jgi:integrase
VAVVLSKQEVRKLVAAIPERLRVCALLMYGAGLRLTECLALRIKDVDFDRHEIVVRDGKGGKDRRTPLPQRAVALLADRSRTAASHMDLSHHTRERPFLFDHCTRSNRHAIDTY